MDSQSQNTSLQRLQNVEKAIPDEVWACGPSAIVLDLSNNFVQDVPAQVGCLRSIQSRQEEKIDELQDAKLRQEEKIDLQNIQIASIIQFFRSKGFNDICGSGGSSSAN